MILGEFIDVFGVKIVIGLLKNYCDLILTVGFDLSQKTDIYRYFFRNFNTCAREIKSQKTAKISPKYREFLIFHLFFRFFSDFLTNRLSVGNIVLGSTDNR